MPLTERKETGTVRRAISPLLPETSDRLLGFPGEDGDSGYPPSFDQWGKTSASSTEEPVKGNALGKICDDGVVAGPVMNSASKKISLLSGSGEPISGLRGMPHHAVLVNNSEHFDPNETWLGRSLNIDMNISMHPVDRHETGPSAHYPARRVRSLSTGAVNSPNHNNSTLSIIRYRERLIARYEARDLVAIAGVHVEDSAWRGESMNELKLLTPDPRGQYVCCDWLHTSDGMAH